MQKIRAARRGLQLTNVFEQAKQELAATEEVTEQEKPKNKKNHSKKKHKK